MSTASLKIFTDGGSRGNPGPSAAGIVIKDLSGKIIHQFNQYLGVTTNNIAEYQGAILALKYLVDSSLKPEKIYFYLDSTLVVNQLNGLWKVKDANLRLQVIEARQLEAQLNSKITYTAIPREKNTQADHQVNLCLDQQ